MIQVSLSLNKLRGALNYEKKWKYCTKKTVRCHNPANKETAVELNMLFNTNTGCFKSGFPSDNFSDILQIFLLS